MPSSGDSGIFEQSADSTDTGDIAGNNIPGTASSSQSSGNTQRSTANANGEIANSSTGNDQMGGLESDFPGSVPGGNMPGAASSTSAGQSNSGADVGVQASGLPGLEPFPGGMPGTGGLEDIFGAGSEGTGTMAGNPGPQGTGGMSTGSGSGNDPLAEGGGTGAGEQGNDPFGGMESGGTVAAGPAGSQGGNGNNPFGDLANGRNQPMTTAERQAELDERLNESMAVFDGMILSEREAAQGAANENGGGGGGAGGGVASGTGGLGSTGQGNGNGDGDSPIVVASAPSTSSSGTGRMPNMGRTRTGDFDNSNQEAFPAPADIPSGNDDDVVARQLREAAMSEPDPELRERLWNEYRAYTGLPIPEETVADFDAID